jgi:phosphoglycerate dehydrogenase-like enzyme
VTWKILALLPLPEDALRGLLGGLGDQADVAVPARRDQAAVRDALPEADIVVGDWSGTLVLDAEAVRHAPRLAFVQQPSVGVDSLDLEALAEAGVPVSNTAGVNADAVAEWCLAASLALLRHLPDADREMRAGGWPQFTFQRRELAGARVGVVGLGPVGAACARMFGALGCRVSYWSRTPKPESHGAVYLDLDELTASSDVLVLAVALADDTRGLFDAVRLSRMPRGAVLVNAARGPIVDADALLAALDAGHLAGAALDVYDTEPPGAADPLRASEKVLLSPHAAAVTPEASTRLIQCVLDNLAAAVEGRPVVNVVNGADPVIRRRT